MSEKVTLSDPQEAWDRLYSVGAYVANFAEDAGNPVDTNDLPVVGDYNDLQMTSPVIPRSAPTARSSKRASREE